MLTATRLSCRLRELSGSFLQDNSTSNHSKVLLPRTEIWWRRHFIRSVSSTTWYMGAKSGYLFTFVRKHPKRLTRCGVTRGNPEKRTKPACRRFHFRGEVRGNLIPGIRRRLPTPRIYSRCHPLTVLLPFQTMSQQPVELVHVAYSL